MSFINANYLIYIVIAYIIIIAIFYKINRGYFKWIKTYWFFDQSILNRISNFIYGISIFLFLLALLDLRGPETKVRTSLPDQKTLIVIDSSLSMLCEDVRPSRFVKSIQIARHFVKSAAGHQIAIVLFSDLQKRLIPFTDDIDLIDSRLAALEKSNSVSGGTNIGQAITEAAGYFESDNMNDEKGGGGNILVFTDAEEGEDNFKIDLPQNINLALVGVGTAKGGNIPIRWEDGSFKGYKTVKNDMVTTRLDEGYIKSIGKNVKNFRYWIANSYSLPTEEIMDFFRATYNQKHNNGDLRVRPVFSHYILIPAILLYCLAVFFGRFHSFRTLQSIVLLCLLTGGLSAEEPKELPADIKKDLTNIKEGKATRTDVLKTAEKLLKAKEDQKAAELYSEYMGKNDEEAIRFNHATSLLKLGKTKEAMPIIQELMNNSQNEDLKNKMRSNLANAIKQQKENKENKKNNKENKDNKQDKNEQDKKDKKDSEKQDDKKNQKPGQNKDEKKDKSGSGKSDKQDNKSGGKEDEKKEDKKKEDKKENKKEDKKDGEGDQKKEEEKPQSLEQKEKEIEQRRRMTKTPGMIKQIMNDDRELQKKMMDTTTKEKGELKPKRDW
jgi:Ca-activated chloride channel family protein